MIFQDENTTYSRVDIYGIIRVSDRSIEEWNNNLFQEG